MFQIVSNMKKLDPNKLDSAPLPPLERDRVENIKSTAAVLVWIGPSIVVCIGLYWPEHRTKVARGYYWVQIIGSTLIHAERLVVLMYLLNWFIWARSQCELLSRSGPNWIWTVSTDCVWAFLAVGQTMIWNHLLRLIELSCIKIIKQREIEWSNDPKN